MKESDAEKKIREDGVVVLGGKVMDGVVQVQKIPLFPDVVKIFV